MAAPVPLGSGEQLSTPNFSEVASTLPLAYIMQQLFPGGLPTPNQVSGNTTPTPSAGVGEGGGNVATSGQPFSSGGGTTFTAGEGVGSSPSGGGTAETGNSAQPSTSQGMQEAANIIGQALAAVATSVTGPFGSLIGFGANVQNPNSFANQIAKAIFGEDILGMLGLSGSADPGSSPSSNATDTGLLGGSGADSASQGGGGFSGEGNVGGAGGSSGPAGVGGSPGALGGTGEGGGLSGGTGVGVGGGGFAGQGGGPGTGPSGFGAGGDVGGGGDTGGGDSGDGGSGAP